MNIASVKENIIKDVARVFFAVISLILVSLLTTQPDRGSLTKSQFTQTQKSSLVIAKNETDLKKQDQKKKKLRRPSSI